MLLPHEREKLETSRSQATDTRTTTAVAGCLMVFVAFGCIATPSNELRLVLAGAVFITTFCFLMEASTHFDARLSVLRLELRSKMNERSFLRELATYRRDIVSQRIASPLESDA